MSFLRVKRKNEGDPKEMLVLKKHKSQDTDVDDVPVFELATPSVAEKDINDIIRKTIRNHDIKSREFDIEKIRKQMRIENLQHRKNNRFRVLTVLRKLDDSSKEELVPIIDVDDSEGKNDDQNNYVYDLYYSNCNVDVSDPDFANNYTIHEVDNKWDIEQESDDEEVLEDEDDSNDENNWRNDYPDEEENNSGSDDDVEEYLCQRMRKAQVSSDYSLSSDEFDEDLYNRKSKKDEYFDYYDEIASDASDDY